MKGNIKINPYKFQVIIAQLEDKNQTGIDRFKSVDICKSSIQQKYAYDNLGKEVEFEIESAKNKDWEYAVIKIEKNKKK